MSTNTALDQIKKRAGKAYEGPWTMDADSYHVSGPNTEGITYDLIDGETSEFIAHARTDIPKLLAALEAVEAGLAGLDVIFDGTSEDDEAIRIITEGLRAAIEEALR